MRNQFYQPSSHAVHSMNRVFIHAIVLSLIGSGIGCALFLAKETRYLLSATDRATQTEVRQHLGYPVTTTTDRDGKAVWIYQVQEFVRGSNVSYEMSGSWWCDEYILHFDTRGILRNWTHTSWKCD